VDLNNKKAGLMSRAA